MVLPGRAKLSVLACASTTTTVLITAQKRPSLAGRRRLQQRPHPPPPALAHLPPPRPQPPRPLRHRRLAPNASTALLVRAFFPRQGSAPSTSTPMPAHARMKWCGATKSKTQRKTPRFTCRPRHLRNLVQTEQNRCTRCAVVVSLAHLAHASTTL